MKYELIQTKTFIGLSQVRRLSDGELGGYVASETNLSQEGNCWIADNAKAYGNAQVYGDAQVYGNATLSDNAQIYGNARLSENARVYGDAMVSDSARVYGNASVYGDAKLYGEALCNSTLKAGNWPASPLFVQGSLHPCANSSPGMLTIGCIEHAFEYWSINLQEIGSDNGYSETQIKEYGRIIELFCKIGK